MIYLVKCVGTEYLKIGYADDVERRVADLQCGCPLELQIVRVIEGSYDLELWLHEKFSHLRHRGEWFLDDGEIIKQFGKHRECVTCGRRFFARQGWQRTCGHGCRRKHL